MSNKSILIKYISNNKSLLIKLIDKQIHVKHAIKTSEIFTYTNTTPINNILSHVHNQIQTFRVFQTKDVASQLSIVGLSTESLTEDSSIIHYSSYFICSNIFFNRILLSFFRQHLKMLSLISFSYSWLSLRLTTA